MRKWISLLALGVLVCVVVEARADKKELKPIKTWKGSIDDVKLQKEAPKSGYISNQKDFAKLWKAWKLGDKVPKVDFKKELVMLATSNGSSVGLTATLDEKGNLTNTGFATSDFGEGFRYRMITVQRDGVKTINGKELK
jgi:hypothetical protein